MIYGISDLHLDHTNDKSMEVFGEDWFDYQNRIFNNWENKVKENDLVLIPGDISWAMRLDEALPDLKRIEAAPGKKILMKGNHDYWWDSLNKLEKLALEDIAFLQNNSFNFNGINIAGTRGWISRDSQSFTNNDEIVFKRELIRLELSLESINNDGEIFVMFHYPPFNLDGRRNEFTEIFKDFNVKKCLYGHLHSDGLNSVIEGEIDGVEYICLSADYLKFDPLLIF